MSLFSKVSCLLHPSKYALPSIPRSTSHAWKKNQIGRGERQPWFFTRGGGGQKGRRAKWRLRFFSIFWRLCTTSPPLHEVVRSLPNFCTFVCVFLPPRSERRQKTFSPPRTTQTRPIMTPFLTHILVHSSTAEGTKTWPRHKEGVVEEEGGEAALNKEKKVWTERVWERGCWESFWALLRPKRSFWGFWEFVFRRCRATQPSSSTSSSFVPPLPTKLRSKPPPPFSQPSLPLLLLPFLLLLKSRTCSKKTCQPFPPPPFHTISQ